MIMPLTSDRPAERLALLARSLSNARSNGGAPAVYFVSPYNREGARDVAYDAAVTAAAQLNKRVLFVDLTEPRRDASVSPANGAPPVAVNGVSLSTARLSGDAFSAQALQELLRNGKAQFELIVLGGESGLTDSTAAACMGVADGVVLVIEAERTRAPVALELKRMAELSGGRVIGAVLNRQRFYIPRWAYALFFPGRRR